jgi:hypothetical protein
MDEDPASMHVVGCPYIGLAAEIAERYRPAARPTIRRRSF